MSIIEEAFSEGRETKIPWSLSQAKKNDIKMQVAIQNMESLAKRQKLAHTVIPIEQICPNSGKVLRVFDSRLQAAKWVVANVLNRPEKNPISVTGNMEMSMRAGWKSYGFYWRIADSLTGRSAPSPKSVPVFVVKGRKTQRFPSIRTAATFLGACRSSVAKYIKKYGECEVDGYRVTVKNTV